MSCQAIHDEVWEDYRKNALRHLSSHRLMRFESCPRTLHLQDIGDIPPRQFAGAEEGRAFHTLRLEGQEAYNEQFVVSDGPINPKTNRPYGRETKKFQEWRALQIGGIITVDEDNLFRRMIELECPAATKLLSRGMAEVTIRGELFGVPAQSRLDWLMLDDTSPVGIVDVKTCENLDRFKFQFRDFKYDLQMGFYRPMARQAYPALGPNCPVFIIAYERSLAARSCVFRLKDDTLAWAEQRVQNLCDEYRQCQKNDFWPTRYEEVREL